MTGSGNNTSGSAQDNDASRSLLKKITNRPGLSHIDFRIGTYADFFETMITDLNREETLENWTHREGDDPGIALLEGASILGDILTSYQELYANEAYLGTAQWRESISDLVRLVGYRLSPGVGGEGYFAFKIKGEKNVTVPSGFPIKAQIEDIDQQVEFETTDSITALPSLSTFNLYHPTYPTLTSDASYFEQNETVLSMETATLEESDVEIIEKDRLMLLDTNSETTTNAKIVIVKKIEKQFDRTNITIEGNWSGGNGLDSIIAYKLGRTFRHFGHNAPNEIVVMDGGMPSTENITFNRNLHYSTSGDSYTQVYPSLSKTEIALESQVDDLILGGNLIVQAEVSDLVKSSLQHQSTEMLPLYTGVMQTHHSASGSAYSLASSGVGSSSGKNMSSATNVGSSSSSKPGSGSGSGSSGSSTGGINMLTTQAATTAVTQVSILSGGLIGILSLFTIKRTVVRSISSFRSTTATWGSLSGPSSVVTIAGDMYEKYNKANIREMEIHETIGGPVTLIPERKKLTSADGTRLDFFGKLDPYLELDGRKLILIKEDGTFMESTVSIDEDEIPTDEEEGVVKLRPLYLDSTLSSPFDLDEFPLEEPGVTVYGNVVKANQGKTEEGVVLGNGDSRQTFQTFKLPKSPLTFHNQVGATPAEVPEIQVYVDNILWTHEDSFYGKGPEDRVYVTRNDEEDVTWVQFGDGKTGSRLPSGIKNVTVKYRTGSGAYGSLKEGTSVQAGKKLDGVEKVFLPGIISGGDEPEDEDLAKEVAPGKVQSLDRLVGLKDYESETLAIPGVSKALSNWELVENIPSIVLTILMESGREEEFTSVQNTLREYNRTRGPQRHSILVRQGQRKEAVLSVEYGLDPSYIQTDVEDAIKDVLGVTQAESSDGASGTGTGGTGTDPTTTSDGLFTLKNRKFGQSEYHTTITGIIQNVEGVVWVKLKTSGAMMFTETLTNYGIVYCGPGEVLCLNESDLTMTAVSTSSTSSTTSSSSTSSTISSSTSSSTTSSSSSISSSSSSEGSS